MAAAKPVDVGSFVAGMKKALASVEVEAKANDPRVLKGKVAELERALATASKLTPPAADPKAIEAAEARGYERGHDDGSANVLRALGGIATDLAASVGAAKEACERSERLLASFAGFVETQADAPRAPAPPERRATPAPAPVQRQPKPAPEPRQSEGNAAITGPQRRVLNALAWWQAFGIMEPTREQVGFVAAYSPGSGGFANLTGGLRSAGLVDYPSGGRLALTPAGAAEAEAPDLDVSRDAFHAQVRAKLSGPQVKVLDPILAAYPAAISSSNVADEAGYSAGSGGFANLRGSLRTIGLIDYPGPGQVRAADWLFP